MQVDKHKINKTANKLAAWLFFTSMFAVVFIFVYFHVTDEEVVYDKYIQAYVKDEGYIECFPSRTFNENLEKASCELSGVAYYHDSLFFVNDKVVPATTPFMGCRLKFPAFKEPLKKFGGMNIIQARKLEDIAVSPDQKYMFLTTAFTHEEPGYNMLLYIPLGNGVEAEEKVAYPVRSGNIISSLPIKKMIRKALKTKYYPNGPEYFKISGIVALPNNQLLFGIREIGRSWKDFTYSVTFIGAEYDFVDGKFFFTEDLEVKYVFYPDTFKQIREKISLTGIDYDIYNDRLIFTSAYEESQTDEGIGGYMWVLPMKDFRRKKLPKLVVDEDNVPLRFAHKPGGIAVLDEERVFIVHDDDRITGSDIVVDDRTQFKRELHQAAWTILIF